MEKLQTALFFDNVPDTWTKLAYPSTYSLAIWCVCVCCYLFFVSRRLTYVVQRCFSFLFVCVRYNDVLQRCKELDSWTQDLSLPSVVWLSGLFNPQSFLTGNTHS